MSLIKEIDRRSVHHIQSGQVINDGLTSAVKELVENSLDANATSIEVRFKNYGLESIEVIDNGDGVSPDNYEGIALKHYTSKLQTYADLESVSTFGFRGEALSSLCALSDMHIITARTEDAPKGIKLEFEPSGKLKSQTVVAASKGTTVSSANLFKTLPVRRKELERNIKREYTKVLGILQAYASICVGVKFSVFNQPAKGKRTPVFATKGNPTTRENISNVFGAKTLVALVSLDLQFELQSTQRPTLTKTIDKTPEKREVKIVGHISRPVVGEGRNAPDRQMFFVNGRPCVLPQISKAINEVYKGFNVTQSPFIFADIQLDTDAYDVNVSPDKRTILLHDQANLLEHLKTSLAARFANHEQTVPVNRVTQPTKLPEYKQLSLNRTFSPSTYVQPPPVLEEQNGLEEGESELAILSAPRLQTKDVHLPSISDWVSRNTVQRPIPGKSVAGKSKQLPFKPPSMANTLGASTPETNAENLSKDTVEHSDEDSAAPMRGISEEPIPSSSMPTPLKQKTAYRSPRKPNAPATITIGDRSPVTTVSTFGSDVFLSPPNKRRKVREDAEKPMKLSGFTSALDKFMAPGTQSSAHREVRVIEEDTEYDEPETPPDVNMEEDQQANEKACEIPAKSVDDSGPLFLPDEDVNMDVDSQEESESEPLDADMSPPLEPDPTQDGDEEYIPEEKARQTANLRAERRLKEAEEAETNAEPSEELVLRARRLLGGFEENNSIRTLVRFINTSADELSLAAQTVISHENPARPSSCTDLLETVDEAAEERLTLTVTKQDFFKMQIKGQFNKGFILATRGDELFIIDQHASDEKYNFETLQATTVVQNQPLVAPRTLDLMAMDEIVVIDHLEILKKNGFVMRVDPEAPTGRRCSLVSLPMSKETTFGVEDLEELIHLIHQNQGTSGNHLRCSKVRSMFAMRACRKSVMVGKALPTRAMEKIVRHMGELDKPWNCPHGRPTMRHLADLGSVSVFREYSRENGRGPAGFREEQWEVNQRVLKERQEQEEAERRKAKAGEDSGPMDEDGAYHSPTDGMG